ncbi:hypothetical protein DPMN_023414 [Dreissena polymorpha]|uniref:Uncharacterized protein n=1 Tax=Dreissena polymorpha TaxID=45954 RepID=A0A9D4LL26_DREPO|nr:hypothetical protein DPMN_023414 [Dreissena polymorpha]
MKLQQVSLPEGQNYSFVIVTYRVSPAKIVQALPHEPLFIPEFSIAIQVTSSLLSALLQSTLQYQTSSVKSREFIEFSGICG